MYPTIIPACLPTVIPTKITSATGFSNTSLTSYPTFTTRESSFMINTTTSRTKTTSDNISQSTAGLNASWTGQTTTQDNLAGSAEGDTLINNGVLIAVIICLSVIVVAVLILIGNIYSKKQNRIQVNKEIELQRVHTVSHKISQNNYNANRDGEDVVVVEKANYLQSTQEEVLV